MLVMEGITGNIMDKPFTFYEKETHLLGFLTTYVVQYLGKDFSECTVDLGTISIFVQDLNTSYSLGAGTHVFP